MLQNRYEDRHLEKIDFTTSPLPIGEYDTCSFVGCNFSNADLRNFVFVECEFTECNFSVCRTENTSFKNARFNRCKLVGMRFDYCDPFLFQVNFEHCSLRLSSFYRLKLKHTTFESCGLEEVDFTEADLTGSTLSGCDIRFAAFNNTILEKVDFRNSFHWSIDPENNRIKGAKFSLNNIGGLLDKYKIVIE
jgi:fluoroquinolone resistance protein